ncbi:uncharacterized protein LOC132628891 [Lycium barbarum]|uniref:uncharacterized protein LOC132628891 n=1 Tax=Lycium barbarum TaxID=112863 RepID=UPI00293E99D5|nr:uncharacterized protein LOC132628891 [Lycium barbarum]
MGKPLNFVPPSVPAGKPLVPLVEDDFKSLEDYWSNAIIGYVIGYIPYEKSMDNYVTYVWNFVVKPQIMYYDNGYYMFRFWTKEDRDLILQSGPYTYNSKPLILKQWEMNFRFDHGSMNVIPLWVKFPRLPVGYWFVKALSKLASVGGKPLYTYKYTANLKKVSYARPLMETDISKPLPEFVDIHTPEGELHQSIEYDWRP